MWGDEEEELLFLSLQQTPVVAQQAAGSAGLKGNGVDAAGCLGCVLSIWDSDGAS